MINIVIMTDNSLQESVLKLYIKEFAANIRVNYELQSFCNNTDINFEDYKMKLIDLAFIVINRDENTCIMKNTKALLRLYPNIVNIFLSENYLQNVKVLCSIRLFDFISLPIVEKNFNKIFLRAINQVLAIRYRKNNTYVLFISQYMKVQLLKNQILYISRENGKTKIVAKGNTIYYSYESLKSFEKKLVYGFQRISQYIIINLSEIVHIEKDVLTLNGDFSAKITRSFKKAFYETYNQNIIL